MHDRDWMSLAVAACRQLTPYEPGKPVERLLAERGLTHAIKLASNENPFGPSPKAVAAVKQAAAGVHRYPDGDASALRRALAAKHDVDLGCILAGNGSNELLELIIRTFAGPGDEVVYAQRGFIVYALAAMAAGAKGVAVAEIDGYAPDLVAMAAAVGPRTKVVCLANPNNPTGSLSNRQALQAFLDRLPRRLIVVLDEAYYEYVANMIGDTPRELSHPGLIICRTFSKAYGLAGLRVGYCIADAAIVALVNRMRQPFNVNHLAQVAALAALDDGAWMEACVQRVNGGRRRLEAYLERLGLLAAESCGNFVLLGHGRAADLLHLLEERGIIARPLVPYGMPDVLRISVGSEEENDCFCRALESSLMALGG